MSRFIFTTNPEIENYCLKIARAMCFFFGITEEDAIARINGHWGNSTFTESDLLYHETPDYWAKWIFFGPESWRDFGSGQVDAVSRMERKLNLILEHLGVDYMKVADHVLMLLRQGKKLPAISLYAKETGVGLKRAQEVVEKMAARLDNS